MKKELITVDNVNNYICKQDGKLYVFGNRLLTAGAKDELGRRRVSVVYGPEPVAAPAPAPAAAAATAVPPSPPASPPVLPSAPTLPWKASPLPSPPC